MTEPTKCPDCGAGFPDNPFHRCGWYEATCGRQHHAKYGWEPYAPRSCLDRQLAQRTAERDAALEKVGEQAKLLVRCLAVLIDVETAGCSHGDEYGPPRSCPFCQLDTDSYGRIYHHTTCRLAECLVLLRAAEATKGAES